MNDDRKCECFEDFVERMEARRAADPEFAARCDHFKLKMDEALDDPVESSKWIDALIKCSNQQRQG